MTPQTPSRRTIVKGAAWSAPVVTIAAAAPSLAASTTAPHDLSTSVPGSGNRISATQIDISATEFINTGTETIEGITVVFSASDGQKINDVQVFGQPIENLAVGATISGEGTSVVTLMLAPGTQLGQVTIAPDGGSYKSPAGQTLILDSSIGFTLTTTVSATNAKPGDVSFENVTQVPAA
ncbi:hypothetical protein NMQ01_13700 [Janibacter sp. CX7]|uniref:hypothetical protein n=1 Tax=Janibacter sp. CX7 TaxID=2963431 RepID=UPI0020CDFC54|nr:hypothetical protein [Janibacter sp. CX7]UTT65734.1 hypothetical protein NMQ01_13700 [Janibacter sp. CX7]